MTHDDIASEITWERCDDDTCEECRRASIHEAFLEDAAVEASRGL